MKKTLLETFDFAHPNEYQDSLLSDYDVFPNKKLLDKLRKIIIEHLVDTEIPEGIELSDFINNEVDKCLEGYDLTNVERNHIYNLIEDEVSGNGPITELLTDDNISEIMVNGPKDVYVEIDGKIVKDTSVSFINNDHIIRTIQRLIGPQGRTIDSSSPMVDSRLKDGSRINAVIPPLSVNGPVITIRKFKRNMTHIGDLLRVGSLTNEMALFLEGAVRGKLNIIVCGGTGCVAGGSLKIYESLNKKNFTPRQLFYYSRELYFNNKINKAITYFKKFLKTEEGFYENKIDACKLLSKCYLIKNQKKQALEMLFYSFNFDVPRAEILCEIGYFYKNVGDFKKAIYYFNLALNSTIDENSLAFVEYDYYNFIPCLELCVCYYNLNNIDMALNFNNLAKKYKPTNKIVLSNENFLNNIINKN